MKKSLTLLAVVLFTMSAFGQEAVKLINRGDSLFKEKKYAEALEIYDKVIPTLEQDKVKESLYYAAMAALNTAKNEVALAYFDKAISAKNADATLKFELSDCNQYKGLVYVRLKDFANAMASYEKALELAPAKPGPIYYSAASAAFNMNNFEKAVEYFGKSYDAGNKPEDAILNKAMAYKRLNNDSLYEVTLITGFEKFPGNKNISSRLAAIYFTDGNNFYKSGVTILNATLKKVNEKKLKVEDAEYKSEIAKVNEAYSKAVEVLKKSQELDPSNANVQKLIDACKPVK